MLRSRLTTQASLIAMFVSALAMHAGAQGHDADIAGASGKSGLIKTCYRPSGPNLCWPGPYVSVSPDMAMPRSTRNGTLRLYIAPMNADVYVDGVYGGRGSDFNGRSTRGDLKPGIHRVDIRAAGYESRIFEVRITRASTIDYHATLQRALDSAEE